MKIIKFELCFLACIPICLFFWIPFATAGITNGENAVNALGQNDDNYSDPSPVYTKGSTGDAPNKYGMSSPRDAVVDTTNHRLFVSEGSNRRILVFNLNADNTMPDRIPDYVIGQSNFYTNASATTSTGMALPVGIAYDNDNDRLFVSDSTQCRVLVYDTSTITNGEAAVYVLGQSDFVSSGCSATQSTFKGVNGLHYDTGRDLLFVADTSSHRVMIFSGSSLSDGMNASYVLGQPDFTTSSSDVTQAKLNSPNDIAYDSTNDRIYVADRANQRVIVYTGSLLNTGMSGAYVIGQANFTSNSPASSQSGFSSPYGVAYDTGRHRLYVADGNNDRVVVFSGALLSNGMNASYVIGQSNYTNNAYSYKANGMYQPQNAFYDTTTDYLYVADTSNNRILLFSGATIVNGMSAMDGLGQSDGNLSDPIFMDSRNYANNYPNRIGMWWPDDVEIDTTNHRLFVEDSSNNRILVYNLDSNNDLVDNLPDYVLGQDDFYMRSTAQVTATGARVPSSLAYDAINNRLYVADSQRNRILVYDTNTITNGEPAAYVLGQTSFTASSNGTTQSKIKLPWGLAYDEVRNYLFVSDCSNHRIMIFDVADITNGENAINVLGQTDFTTATSGTAKNKLKYPRQLAYDSSTEMLYIVEDENDRVMVYNVSSITDGMSGSYVLGQADFTSAATATTGTGMNNPKGIEIDSGNSRLFVGEHTNNRVLVFDVSSISNGEAAVNVLGQTDLTSNTSTTTQSGIDEAYGMAYDSGNGKLYVADYANSRVVVYNVSVPAVSGSVSSTATSSGATIAWTSSFSGSTKVEVGPTTTYDYATTETDISTRTTSHSVNIQGLSSCALYNYRVISTDDESGSSTGSNLTFRTTGCTGDASVESSSGVLIGISGTGSVALAGTNTGITLTVPPNFSTNSAHFQITKINSASVLATTGNVSGRSNIARIYSLLALSGSTTAVTSFLVDLSIAMEYTDAEVSGYVESTLNIYRWDGSSWNQLSNCTVDTVANTVTCTTTAFSEFGLFGELNSTSTSTTSTSTISGGSRGGSSGLGMAYRIATARSAILARYNGYRAQNIVQQNDSMHTSALKKPDAFSSDTQSISSIAERRGFLYAIVNTIPMLYHDVPDDAWFTPYVAFLIGEEIAEGYRNEEGKVTGEFGVGSSITYAEVLKMSLEAANADISKLPPPRNKFVRGTWATAYVAKAEELNLSIFDPNLDVHSHATRGEVIQTILEVLNIPIGNVAGDYSDLPPNHLCANAIGTATWYGLIEGDTDENGTPLGTVRPDTPINRAEVAKIIALAREVTK
ncbi:MAG: S-layer homology domain-containing protein [Candidatus Peribacteraceae bacterium]|nr:S-layer homology domain-containing protein [Candidatus Peribacteraceae bacterium]